jgi:hypothetical protein
MKWLHVCQAENGLFIIADIAIDVWCVSALQPFESDMLKRS